MVFAMGVLARGNLLVVALLPYLDDCHDGQEPNLARIVFLMMSYKL